MIKGMLYLFALMFIFLGIVLHQTDIKNDKERNIYNYTENKHIWNSSIWEIDEINTTNVSMTDAFTFRATNVLNKFVDFLGYIAFQVIKLGIEFGYEKAYAYEPESFVAIAKLIFIIVIIGFIIPIIVPVLALIYILFEGLKWIINKFQNKNG